MLNLLTQMPEGKPYDLSSLEFWLMAALQWRQNLSIE